jgi:PhzF family phenazine biosynthesis protein
MTPTLTLQFYTVDAFTTEAFSGNAAAVFVLAPLPDDRESRAITDATYQKIANEFNLAETAFTQRLSGDGKDPEEATVPSYSLRFFTPT